MPLPEDVLDAAALASLRADYESGACALAVLARRFAISPKALASLARRLNFGARPPIAPFQRRGPPPTPGEARTRKTRPASPAGKTKRAAASSVKPRPTRRKSAVAPSPEPPSAPAPGDPVAPAPALKPLDMQAMAERLRQAAARELVKINDQLEAGADVERHARTLASLVKTLGDLARLADARDAERRRDSDDGGWTLDDLNAEIEKQVDFIAQGEPSPPAA